MAGPTELGLIFTLLLSGSFCATPEKKGRRHSVAIMKRLVV